MKNITKIGIFVFILLLIPLSVRAYGVTKPLPYDVELLQGEEGRFRFQIQIQPAETSKKCTYSIDQSFPLDVTFQDEHVSLSSGEVRNIIGFVRVPDGTSIGTFTGELCVSCVDQEGQGGTVIKQDVCGFPITVNVVSTRTKDNMVIPVAEEEPVSAVNLTLLIVVSIIFLIVIIAYVIVAHKKHEQQQKKKWPMVY